MIAPSSAAEIAKACSVLEREFGAKWLARKAKVQTRHRVPSWWNSLVDLKDNHQGEDEIPVTSADMADALEMSNVIDVASSIKGYEEAIAPRLKGAGFSKALYEMQIAKFGVQADAQVQFVVPAPNAPVRNPDLSFTFGEYRYWVECKKKDAYIDSKTEDTLWQRLEAAIEKTLDITTDSYGVVVIVYDKLNEAAIPSVADALRSAIEKRYLGELTHPTLNISLWLEQIPIPDPSQERQTLAVPTHLKCATAWMDVDRDADGVFHVRKARRIGLYTVDSHRLSAVIQSFDRARKQLPKDSKGVIYIDLDLSSILPQDVGRYLNAAGRAIAGLFRPSHNMRVVAVVLTSSVMMSASESESPMPGMLRSLCRNPYCNGTLDWVVPVGDFSSTAYRNEDAGAA